MNIVENENAVKIIKALIPEKILELNPVIAGGFIVSLYHLAIRHSSPKYDADLAFKIERALDKKVWITSSERILADLKIEKKFGDIDFWFLKDNKIWEEDHSAKFLLKDFVSDEEEEIKGMLPSSAWMAGFSSPGGGPSIVTIPQGSQHKVVTTTFPHGMVIMTGGGGGGGITTSTYKKSSGRRKTFKNEIKNHPNMFANFGLSEEIDNSSYWANTFTTDAKSSWDGSTARIVDNLKIQIVKKTYETIDELFTKFDMINCCAAYHDGLFYFHDEFDNCFNSHILTAGDSFFKPTTLGKIWSANRSFKYAKRFELEFSQEVCQSITETFIESEILLDKIKGLNGSDLIDLGTVEEINDPYGMNGTVSVEKLNGMIMNLFGSGPALFSMKEFDMNCIFTFINSKHHAIKEYVKNYIEKEGDNFRQQQEQEKKSSILTTQNKEEDTDERFAW